MTYVRRAMPDDLPEILVLARAFHAESPVHRDHAFNEGKVTAMLEAAMFDPDWLAIIALQDDAIVGMVLMFATEMFYSDAREAGDLTFYVAPDQRNGFVALRMLAKVREWAKNAQVVRVSITPNTGINHHAAHKFFTRAGFMPSSTTLTLTL